MKQKTINSLESIIGRLIDISTKIPGNQLQDAIREIERIKARIERDDIKLISKG